MKLADYLSKTNQTATDFASRVDCETSTITRILRGERSPSVHLAVRIEKATSGQVSPGDFTSRAKRKSAA